MNSVTFNCEIITPMFLAGADGKSPELRPSSIKGALRFWWRAMHGDLSITELHAKESSVFGCGGEHATRSRISIDVRPHTLPINQGLSEKKIDTPSPTLNDPERTIRAQLFTYLAYGAHQREYFKVGSQFSVTFRYHKLISPENDFVIPFELISFFGGLGARGRNGFGSFKILSCDDSNVKLHSDPKSILRKLNSGLPCGYTAFSEKSKLFKTTDHQVSWEKSLEVIGTAYIKEKRKLENAHTYDKRAFIAAPIVQSDVLLWHKERHAKQYFLSVTRNVTGTYDGWILFLPYKHHKNTTTDNYGKATTEFNNGLKRHLIELI